MMSSSLISIAGGRILNPKTARSQTMGSVVWGISMALHEETFTDRDCRHRRPVANAIFHATGKRVRDLPITLDKVI